MATVSFILKSKKDPAHIYARFTNGRGVDFPAGTGLYINPIYWDKKNQKIRNVISVPNREAMNSKLEKLKIYVIDRFNMDYSEGEIIDKDWFARTIKQYFNRPKGEETKQNIDHKIYFSNFCDWWLKNEASKWKTSADAFLDEKGKGYYELVSNLFKDFEGKQRYKIKDIDNIVISNFIDYLIEEKKYGAGTCDLYKTKFKFFCNRISEAGLPINPNYKAKLFSRKQDEGFKEPYLSEREIEHIFKFDFSHDNALDNVRDSFIIGLWTGLRVSDFNTNLKLANIVDGFIEIRTQKTKRWVSIPLHPMVKQVLEKRNGQLPKKLDDSWFNKQIKEVCRIAGIQNEMKGSIKDPKTNRKVVGMYPKYKLVSSHICRRSFATNNVGIVTNKILMDIGGWETERIFLKYIKKSNKEQANELALAWNKKYATN